MCVRRLEPVDLRQTGAICIMDKRKEANRQVKDRLLAALLELSQERELSQVKVTELVERSGVARASFYRNFGSVEDIVDYGIGRMARLYHEGMPRADGGMRSREVLRYKFRFYREHADIVLAFHRAHLGTSLLDVVTECEIVERGDMPASSIERYELYYFSGAFYNMLVCWLEGGMRESPRLWPTSSCASRRVEQELYLRRRCRRTRASASRRNREPRRGRRLPCIGGSAPSILGRQNVGNLRAALRPH